MKRFISFALVILTMLTLVGCNSEKSIQVVKTFDYKEIATWTGMETPDEGGGPAGTAEANNELEFARIFVGSDGWGGVQSTKVTFDLSKGTHYLAIRIFESHDGFKWGVKFTPSDPEEGHEWGFYLIEDNNFKWNKYAAVNVNEALKDFADAYGNKFEGVLWVYATGGEEASVDVSSLSLLLMKK